MPFIGLTPESLLPRSDSKNPATTCKGITSSGRPCRRSISTAKSARNNGVLAVISVDSDDDEGAAAYFCWQHKEQAEKLAAANSSTPQGTDTRLYPLQERSSIDTLVARLGVLEVDDAKESTKQSRNQRRPGRNAANIPPRRVNRPPTWEQVQGPLMAVPSDVMASGKHRTSDVQGASRPQRPMKKSGFWESLCCVIADDDDYVEVVRHKRRIQNQVSTVTAQYTSEPPLSIPSHPQRTYQTPHGQDERRKHRTSGLSPNLAPTQDPVESMPVRKPLGEKTIRPLNKTASRRPSETTTLLSHIPKNLSPQTTSILLAELSKPISEFDEEGYIYIFWLTSESAGPPPSNAASTLLSPPSRPDQGRRTSDLLRQYSVHASQRPATSRAISTEVSNPPGNDKRTILLKIGRANNVHRRMNEWTRQCGYSLSLVRWYPYVTSTPTPSSRGSPANSRRPSQDQSRPSDPMRRVSDNVGVRKVPHAHRVERLIHLELADRRVKKNCEACGKGHREWFEVDATRDGVKGIDEVVRRWVDWAERRPTTE